MQTEIFICRRNEWPLSRYHTLILPCEPVPLTVDFRMGKCIGFLQLEFRGMELWGVGDVKRELTISGKRCTFSGTKKSENILEITSVALVRRN